MFGKDTFKEEETFDTLIACEKCLGVGQESSIFALHGLMPRKLVDDVTTLKMDVQTLNEKVRVFQQYYEAQDIPYNPVHEHDEEMRASHEHHQKEHREHQFATEDLTGVVDDGRNNAPLPIVTMARRESLDIPETDGSGDGVQAGAETASMDAGPMQMISHRRGSTIAELFRLASK